MYIYIYIYIYIVLLQTQEDIKKYVFLSIGYTVTVW